MPAVEEKWENRGGKGEEGKGGRGSRRSWCEVSEEEWLA